MPLKTALSRTCDSPTKARLPAKSTPRVKPGTSAIGSYLRVFGSMNPNVPAPDSQTQSRPAYHRGEWGIDSPRVITSPEATSIRMPPLALFARQPTGSSVSPKRRDVARAAVLHPQAVQVAAVGGLQRR